MAGPSNGHEDRSSSDNPEAFAAQLTAPTALRKLVLNYLIHHCYVDTAQAFADDGISSSAGTAAGALSTGKPGFDDVATSSGMYAPSAPASGPSHRTANGGSSHSRTSSRLASAQSNATTAHPLSAPPLSREDSGMEVEVDNLLSLASAGATGDARASELGGHGDKTMAQNGGSADGKRAQFDASSSVLTSSGNEELSADELQNVRIRKEVRDHIVAGRIKQAIDLCHRHFPTVLDASEAYGTSKNGQRQTPSALGQEKDRANGKGDDESSGVERILPANPTSLDPAHLSLNLQIQAFIESVRAASTSNATSPALASAVSMSSHQGASAMPNMHSIVSSTPGIAAAAVSRSASPAPSSTSSTGSATSANGLSGSAHSNGGSSTQVNPVLHAALRHAQTLYSEVQKLPAYWRAMYLKELESVTTMLAYTDLERSPVRKYLDQSRRVALAEQINSAIMFRTGKPSQPLIESAVRQTTFCWSTMAQDKVVVPSHHWLFASGTVVGVDNFDSVAGSSAGGTGSSTAVAASTAAADRSKNKGKVLPSWDLHSFLRER